MSLATPKRRPDATPSSTPIRLGELWDAHVHNEFQAKDTSATLDTMWHRS